MKRFLLLIAIVAASFLTVGCGFSKEDDVIKKLSKKINEAESYHISGVFELRNNEENYLYDIEVDYKKDNKFRVSLLNQTNNHEQIILRNDDGVYVKTQESTKQKLNVI